MHGDNVITTTYQLKPIQELGIEKGMNAQQTWYNFC